MKRIQAWLMMLGMTAVAFAGESFESLPTGKLTAGVSMAGKWLAEPGHAQITEGHARSSNKALQLVGGDQRRLTLELAPTSDQPRELTFWAERWTSRGGFELLIEAKVKSDWTMIKRENQIKVGGYLTHVSAVIPAAASALRFTCSSDGGVLIDDLTIARNGPMTFSNLSTNYPNVPILTRKAINPAAELTLTTEGNQQPISLEMIELSLANTTRINDIDRIEIYQAIGKSSKPIASTTNISRLMAIPCKSELESGDNQLTVSVRLKPDADIDGKIAVTLTRIKIGNQVRVLEKPISAQPQRIGVGLRLIGDDGSKAYRIPGMVQTKAGSLIAVYDIRYHHCGDLPAQIDVGVSRSTHGGKRWEDMRIALNPGTMGDIYQKDGAGDPAVLVDAKTGRIWVAALWSHGNHAWGGSKSGLTPDETGQLLLVHSDDDGKTWSAPRNITTMVKKPEWRLCFNGPGAGITMQDGTLVFAAQFRAADGGETKGKPYSTILFSKDHGETWNIGTGARADTTEAQVVEMPDHALMLNCRDNRGGSRTVMVTRDLGQSWTAHTSDRKALAEPVCMASLLRWNHPTHGDLLIFSNPASTSARKNMSIKISHDAGTSWPAPQQLIYDERNGCGYSCLAPADNDHLGVLYEGQCELYFLRIPLTDCLK